MGIPVIETSTQNEGTDIATLTLTKPSGVVSGDLLLIICMNENTGASEGFGAITSETGWTQIFNEGNTTSDSYVAAYWRESDGADDATVIVPLVTTQSGGGFYLRVSGADTADVVNIIGTFNDNGGATTPITAASVTTDANDCLVFGAFTFDGGDGGTVSTSGTGWPTAVDDQYDIGTNSGSQGAYVTKELATAGASQAVTFSTSAQQDQCGAIQFAINGASGTSLSPGTETLVVVGVAPTVIAGDPEVQTIAPAGEILTVIGSAPTLGVEAIRSLSIDAGILTLESVAPALQAESVLISAIDPGTLLINGLTPQAVTTPRFIPASATLVVQGFTYNAIVQGRVSLVLEPDPGILTLTGIDYESRSFVAGWFEIEEDIQDWLEIGEDTQNWTEIPEVWD